MRKALPLLLLLLTTARAERRPPGANEAQGDASGAQCDAKAAMAVPPAMIRRIAAPARIMPRTMRSQRSAVQPSRLASRETSGNTARYSKDFP